MLDLDMDPDMDNAYIDHVSRQHVHVYRIDAAQMAEGLEADFLGGRPGDKILYDLLVCCKWPEVASGLVS